MSKIKTTISGKKIFKCPGCKSYHSLAIRPAASPSWEYNGNADAPTFKPSILAWHEWPAEDGQPAEKHVCHSFVNDGKIQFLNDCTHELKGQTVEIPEWPFASGEFGGVID